MKTIIIFNSGRGGHCSTGAPMPWGYFPWCNPKALALGARGAKVSAWGEAIGTPPRDTEISYGEVRVGHRVHDEASRARGAKVSTRGEAIEASPKEERAMRMYKRFRNRFASLARNVVALAFDVAMLATCGYIAVYAACKLYLMVGG